MHVPKHMGVSGNHSLKFPRQIMIKVPRGANQQIKNKKTKMYCCEKEPWQGAL